MKIKDKLQELKENDIYSLSMFVLYKLIELPEYSTLSELPYIIDKTNLLNLCEYYGGKTIKIPTIKEIYSIMNVILLYQYVNIEGKDYTQSIKDLGLNDKESRAIQKIYQELCKALSNYDFKARKNYDQY